MSTSKFIGELVKIENVVICPHCGAKNERTENNKQDMNIYGKTVFNCDKCDRLFTLCDDGDGEYIRISHSQQN